MRKLGNPYIFVDRFALTAVDQPSGQAKNCAGDPVEPAPQFLTNKIEEQTADEPPDHPSHYLPPWR